MLRCRSYYRLWNSGFPQELPYFSWRLSTRQRPALSHSFAPSVTTSPFTHISISLTICLERWLLLLCLSLSWQTRMSHFCSCDGPPLFWDSVFLSTASHWLSVTSRALLTSPLTALQTPFYLSVVPLLFSFGLHMDTSCMSAWASLFFFFFSNFKLHLFICLNEWSVTLGHLKDANLERFDLVFPIQLHLIWLHGVINVW